MARKPNTITELVEAPMNEAAFQQAEAAGRELMALEDDAQRRTVAVAAQLGYDGPLEPELIQRDIAANMRRSVEACLEVGRGLRVLKEACGHGNFMARLDALGLDVNVAGKFMQAARRLSNSSLTMNLSKAINSQTKLFEMLILDDGQLEELELTGQTGELKLDDIATMSVKELRFALREARAEGKATDQVLADKVALVTKLQTKQARIKPPTPDQIGADLRSETSKYALEAEALVRGALRDGFTQLRRHADETDSNHDEYMAGILAQVERAIAEVRGELEIKRIADGNPMPEWMRADGASAPASAA